MGRGASEDAPPGRCAITTPMVFAYSSKRFDKRNGPVGTVTQRPIPAWVRHHVHAHPSPRLLLFCLGRVCKLSASLGSRRARSLVFLN